MSNTNLNSNTNSSKSLKDQGVNVQVILRCRPVNTQEIKQRVPFVVTCNESTQEVSLQQSNRLTQLQQKTYHFDRVFGPKATQEQIYNEALIPMVNEVLAGFNCTIFAYGQTGTGKTYTMEGNTSFNDTKDMQIHAGVIPRAISQIFQVLEQMQGSDYTVKVSHMEIYNEELTDLLAPNLEKAQQAKIRIMEDKQGVVVQGIEDVVVRNSMEIFEVLARGSAQRTTAETLLNKQSSRSHSIFTVTIHIKEQTKDSDDVIKIGKLNLVDLAGSENISRSGARDCRFREAASINQSLLTLGRVITALTEHSGHIPYRDSKLTRLLRDSLGGRTKTCIIATIAPTALCLEETVNTLDYAHRAKNIRNKPEINQRIAKGALIKELSEEIEKLRGDLMAAREKNGVYLQPDRLKKLEEEHNLFFVRVQELESLNQQENDRSKSQLKEQEDALKQQKEIIEKAQYDIAQLEEITQNQQQQIAIRNDLLDKANQYQGQLYDHGQQLTQKVSDLAQDLHTSMQHLENYKAQSEQNKQIAQNLKETTEEQSKIYVNSLVQISQLQNDSVVQISQNQTNQDKQSFEFTEQIKAQVKAIATSIDLYQKQIKESINALQTQSDAIYQTIGSNLQSTQAQQQQQNKQAEQIQLQKLELCQQHYDQMEQKLQVQLQNNLDQAINFSNFQEQVNQQSLNNISNISNYLGGTHQDLLQQSQNNQKKLQSVQQLMNDVYDQNQSKIKETMIQTAQKVLEQNKQYVQENIEKMLSQFSNDFGQNQKQIHLTKSQIQSITIQQQNFDSKMAGLQQQLLSDQDNQNKALQESQKQLMEQTVDMDKNQDSSFQILKEKINKYNQEYNQSSQDINQGLSNQMQQKVQEQNQLLRNIIAPSFLEVSNTGQKYVLNSNKMEKQQLEQIRKLYNTQSEFNKIINSNANVQKEDLQSFLGKRLIFQANTENMPKTKQQLPTTQDLNAIVKQYGEKYCNEEQQFNQDAENKVPMDLQDNQINRKTKQAKHNMNTNGLQENGNILAQSNTNKFNQSCSALPQQIS